MVVHMADTSHVGQDKRQQATAAVFDQPSASTHSGRSIDSIQRDDRTHTFSRCPVSTLLAAELR
jgi:hypothetical protein